MENFVVSARKYRPTTFDSMVGQAAISRTLKNAIKTNHLAQAFLFCGSRGVGKTSCARILAKTLNCSNRTEEIEACNQCDSCKSFNEGASLNVHELDAASNNSVDDIRQLIDQVRFAPQIGSHKVYIIDEVHMLSQSAFNAFLKTLEEPPAHAIFILATTEKHKIIPTILSRCQIFDFNRISVDDISKHLLSIAQKEGVEVEEEALHLIAEKADGALRDALSIFDQLVSFSGKKLSYQNVLENLNILDYDYYFKCTNLLNECNIPGNLLLFNQILQKGFDGRTFINGLAAHFRNLLVGKDQATIQLLEVGQSIRNRYLEQAKECSVNFLIEALDHCKTCDLQYANSKNKRLLIEITLMQIASVNQLDSESVEKKKPALKPAEPNAKSSNSSPVDEKPLKPILDIEKHKPEVESEKAPAQTNQENDQNKGHANKEKEASGQKNKPIERSESKEVFDSTKPLNLMNGQRAKTSSLSISQLTKNEEKNRLKEEKQAYTSSSREAFSSEKFLACWKTLTDQIEAEKKEGSSIVVSAMRKHQPELSPNFKIKLPVDNKSQLEEMQLKRTELHDYLRKKLKNGGIELEFEIERNPTKKKAYTDEEKFQEMTRKNPHLNRLRKDFGFEFT